MPPCSNGDSYGILAHLRNCEGSRRGSPWHGVGPRVTKFILIGRQGGRPGQFEGAWVSWDGVAKVGFDGDGGHGLLSGGFQYRVEAIKADLFFSALDVDALSGHC